MKVDINRVSSFEEESAVINAVEVTEDIKSAIDILSQNCRVIPVTGKEGTLVCPTDKIYYFESVDGRTYVYTKNCCYETKYRLYELDSILSHNFIRAAKAMIVNVKKIQMVRSEINGRMTAELLNGEKVIIARSYVKNLKERLGI